MGFYGANVNRAKIQLVSFIRQVRVNTAGLCGSRDVDPDPTVETWDMKRDLESSPVLSTGVFVEVYQQQGAQVEEE